MYNTIVAHNKTIHIPLPQQFFCLPTHRYFITFSSHLRPSRMVQYVLYRLPWYTGTTLQLFIYRHTRGRRCPTPKFL
ncbi:MAG: hypothetical protein IJE18_06195 [Bacteroidaceae bacterium]|nr:hypothetical protein [Bacteroidaceae bacterium]